LLEKRDQIAQIKKKSVKELYRIFSQENRGLTQVKKQELGLSNLKIL